MDNTAIKNMINSMSSGCKNCMVLIRKIVMAGLINNVKICAKFVPTKKNFYADVLSRFQRKRLQDLTSLHGKSLVDVGEKIPDEIWQPQKIWIAN